MILGNQGVLRLMINELRFLDKNWGKLHIKINLNEDYNVKLKFFAQMFFNYRQLVSIHESLP